LSRDLTDVIGALRGYQPHLYAVLDSARDIEVLAWLRGSGLAYQCLFQGEKAVSLAEEAPYLAQLGDGGEAISSLVGKFHDGGAVSYLVSSAPFYAIRRHLRRIQFVKTEEDETLFFRFYDPRIARVFLPTCDAKQIDWMFGGVVQRWLAEALEPGGLVDLHTEQDESSASAVVRVRKLVTHVASA
jgi:Domain of unknown function (DUF4123)